MSKADYQFIGLLISARVLGGDGVVARFCCAQETETMFAMRLSLRILFFMSTLLLAASAQAATRVAVVDVGVTDKVPSVFLDLVLIELGKQPDFALLERTDVNRLLREQALGLGISGEQAVKAGRLWTADAFLMLEASTNGATRVR